MSLELRRESLVVTEMLRRELDTDEGLWDEQTHLLAGIHNVLQDIRYLDAVALWAKQKKPKEADKPKPPTPIRPPGWKPPKKKMATTKEAAAFFGGTK